MAPLTAPAPHPTQALGSGSQLTQQIQHEKEVRQGGPQISPSASPLAAGSESKSSRSSSKSRSLSDAPKPSLSPSPAFRESNRTTKDDIHVTSSPVTPRRPNFPVRGLSLQMPQPAGLNGVSGFARVPLSPKLDSSQTFGSPGSVLPRRSRGLDFSRACTNLHHSTLAESSPDSSPTITGKSMPIPRRGFANPSSVLDSPSNSLWSTAANPDRSTGLSSSVSSVNMLDSDSNSSDSSDGDAMDPGDGGEEAMLTTPQVYKLGNTSSNPFATGLINSPGGDWMGNYSPASASLMRLQRGRYRNARSRKSSSSASGNSTKPSPGPLSPPLIKSIEATNGGYFAKEMSKREVQSRRESLSLGTSDLHLSDISDEGEGAVNGSRSSSGGLPGTPVADGARGVIKRAVTRRSNLLPKSKNFARIRAALLEESTPVDSELKREGEVIRQVRDSEPIMETSPALIPTTSNESNEAIIDDDIMISDSSAGATAGSSATSFSQHAEKNSGGLKFWNQWHEERYRTPPPLLNPRGSSSGISDDLNMDTPPSSLPTAAYPDLIKHQNAHSRSRSSTPVPSVAPTASEVARKANNKRRRDDDFDPASFKRRAVSPGMSVQSSPVMPQSPIFSKDGNGWGHPPPKAASGHANGDRSNSAGNSGAPKRVGLQGMTETHDGLMNMTIE